MEEKIIISDGQGYIVKANAHCLVSYKCTFHEELSSDKLYLDSLFIMRSKNPEIRTDKDISFRNNQDSKDTAISHIDASHISILFERIPQYIDIIDLYLYIQSNTHEQDDCLMPQAIHSLFLEFLCNSGQSLIFEFPKNPQGISFRVVHIEKTSTGWMISNSFNSLPQQTQSFFQELTTQRCQTDGSIFKPEIIYDYDDYPIVINYMLEHVHYADLYEVSYKCKEKVLVWYLPQDYLLTTEQRYVELQNSINEGAPSKAFAWPESITKCNGSRFGYIITPVPSHYQSIDSILIGKTKLTKDQQLKICRNIVRSIEELHNRGLCFKQLHPGDYYVNTKTNEVLYWNYDYIAPQCSLTNIGYCFGTTAPEIIKGNREINCFTDLYALSILLFKLMVRNSDPFCGKKYFAACITEKLQTEMYISNPIFIFDPHEQSNRPKLCSDIITREWKMMSESIQRLFIKAFSKVAIDDPSSRVTVNEWAEELNRDTTSLRRQRIRKNITKSYSNHISSGLSLLLGLDEDNNPRIIKIDQLHSLLIVGDTASGKTSYVISIIQALKTVYSPIDFQLAIICKNKDEYKFINPQSPYLLMQVIDIDSDYLQMFNRIHEEATSREQELLGSKDLSIAQYNQNHPDSKIPRLLFIIDSVPQAIAYANEHFRSLQKNSYYYDHLGIHFIITAQSITSGYSMFALYHYIPTRIILHLSRSEDAHDLVGGYDTASIQMPYFLFSSKLLGDNVLKLKRLHLDSLINSRLNTINSNKIISFSETQFIWIEYDNNEYDHSNQEFLHSAYPDFDMFTLLLNDTGKVNTESDFLFYNNLKNESNSVFARGDDVGNLDARQDGVYIDFSKIPENINQIAIFVKRYLPDEEISRYEIYSRPVEKLIIRDIKGSARTVRPLISTIEFEREDFETDITHLCSIARNGLNWMLRVVSEGIHCSLSELTHIYGIEQ